MRIFAGDKVGGGRMVRMRLRAAWMMLVLTLGWRGAGIAQSTSAASASPVAVGAIAGHPDWPVAKPADVHSADAIVAAVYDVISGPKGQARDWNRMRSLFVPDARLIPIRSVDSSAGSHSDVTLLSIDGYIARASGRMAADGFFERSVANRVEAFGNLVSVWSTYESRHAREDANPFARGINSFQLLKDGDRFWVIQITWDAEAPGKTIPAKYLSTP